MLLIPLVTRRYDCSLVMYLGRVWSKLQLPNTRMSPLSPRTLTSSTQTLSARQRHYFFITFESKAFWSLDYITIPGVVRISDPQVINDVLNLLWLAYLARVPHWRCTTKPSVPRMFTCAPWVDNIHQKLPAGAVPLLLCSEWKVQNSNQDNALVWRVKTKASRSLQMHVLPSATASTPVMYILVYLVR